MKLSTDEGAFDDGSVTRRELCRRRRRLIWAAAAFTLICTAGGVALAASFLSEDSQSWNDESQVLHTQGTVVEEVRGGRPNSCRGLDYNTRLEWTQGNETLSGWTGTCASGPDVGDRVDMWVRDDGKITLTEPSTTTVFIVFGILAMIGLTIMLFFSYRPRIRAVNKQLTALATSAR